MTHSAPAVLDMLTPDWLQTVLKAAQLDETALEELAIDMVGIQRRRKVRTIKQLLTLLLIYVISDASLKDVAAYSTSTGVKMTSEAVRQRFHKMEDFLERLLSLIFTVDLDFHEMRRVVIVDGTTVQSPSAKGTDFRLHTLMILSQNGVGHVELTDGKGGETLMRSDLHKGDLVMADCEYCRAKDVQALVDVKVDVLLRFSNHHWPGQPATKWRKQMEALSGGATATFTEELPSGQAVYIHVLALPEEQANEARRKKRQSTKKKTGKVPSELTLFLAGYVMVLTTIPPAQLPSEQALAWYRRRWQIEILFKRQKSLLGLSELRSKRTSALSRVWLLAKMLYSFLVDHGARWEKPLPNTRDRSVWRAWRLAREVLRVQLWLPLLDWRLYEQDVIDVLTEGTRTRRTQSFADLIDALQEVAIA